MNIMIGRIIVQPRDRKGRLSKGPYRLATALAALCAHTVGAWAQTAPSTDTASASTKPADEVAPGDIVVTALRRSQQLQDVPLTLSAVTGDALQEQGVTSLVGVAAQTPGVFLGTAGNARPVLYVRGIGTRQVDPGSESSIASKSSKVRRVRSMAAIPLAGLSTS